MFRVRQLLATAALLVFCGHSSLQAQLPQTRIYSVFPPGGQTGQTFEVTITSGEDTDELKSLHFTHPGITAVPKTQEVEGKPQPVDNVFVVTIAADVPPGVYEVAAEGRFGGSNTRRFVVGSRPEFNETEGNNDPAQPSVFEVGAVCNGKMDGGTDVDWYKFTAVAGQRLVIDCDAESIDSRMNAALEVYDATARRRLEAARGYRRQDALLVFDVPANGEYLVRVFDHTFRNGNDYFYRLTVHQGPHIAYVMPPAGLPGSNESYTLYGYNLPGGQPTEQQLHGVMLEQLAVSIAVPADGALLDAESFVSPVASGTDAISWRLDTPEGVSNPVQIFAADGARVLEVEPNNEATAPQAVPVPADIAGQFSEKGDVDFYEFSAAAGDVLYIEAFGERIGSRADPYLTIDQVVVDAEGNETLKRLAAQDDVATTLYPLVFDTHTDDAVHRLQVPADGKYRVSIRDRAWEIRGDPGLIYRLVIRHEQPDFRLVAVPIAPTAGQAFPVGLRRGDNFPVNILAFRRDGFTGPIDVAAVELPEGVSTPGTTIGTGDNSATLALTATVDAQPGWHQIKLSGQAHIDDPAAVRAVAAAEAAVTNAEKPIADLTTALNAAAEKLQQATQAQTDAQKAADDNPGDEALSQKAVEAQKALDAAKAEHDKAAQNLQNAETALAQAKEALTAAEAQAAEKARRVEHLVRAGSVVWASGNNIPAKSRVANALVLSVMPEAAPFQVLTEMTRVTANQSRQILLPVAVERRNGFEEQVALNFAGLRQNANIEAPNGAAAKGESEKVLRIFVKDNAQPGVHTLWLTTTGQVQYARNPEKAARLKQAHETLAAETKTAMELSQAATKAKTEAVQKATQSTTDLKKAQEVQAAAAKAVPVATTAVAEAKKVKTAADKKAADAAAALKTAEAALTTAAKVLEDAEKAVTDAEAKVKAATEALADDPENEDLKKQKADADAALAAAQAARDTAKTAAAKAEEARTKAQQANEVALKEQTDAATKVTEAETALKTAKEALTKADEALKTATAADKTAQEAKVAAEKAEQEAVAKATALENKRKAAEKAATDAENAAKPQAKNFTPTSTPIVIEVNPAPVKLAAAVPNSGALKQGEQIEIKVTVTRQNGFAGAVALSLPLPPGVAGLTAPDVTIPADQTEAVLAVTAAADATEGQLANMVIRGSMEFDGDAAVDVPITLTVSK